MPAITPEVYTSMGLTTGEYSLILELLGREPSYTELGMFAVMWSEHCGYKYSRPVLAAFAKYKEALEGQGFENAGVVDIGDGLAVTMKVESHNHPSAVEPYQGAATGVGGIIRDILTMGARPIASLNSLRFGPIRDGEAPPDVVRRNRYLFDHVVAGIAGYGNCVGVPTVGGEVAFHRDYSGNPLVNAMCVGLLRHEELTTSGAAGEGNPVLYLGSATGRDGIHGATFASDTLDEEGESKRPNVQIGDPFAEKQLIEATLEALATGAIVAIQDMGAAGLTCSTIEMSAKGGVGMKVDLDLVPMRESDMSGYELMLSESQERMLAVASRGREGEVIAIFEKWGVPAVVIGHVTAEPLTVVTRHGHVEASVSAELLADRCPTYEAEATEPQSHRDAQRFDPRTLPNRDPAEALVELLAHPSLASKRWVYEQYDQDVQTQTAAGPGSADAAVLAPRGTQRGLALTLDGNERVVRLDPFVGGQLVVCEAARNVACTGARPRAVTDGLNYGNPQNPEVFWQFRESVQGIAKAAEALGTPVISGNVSFYNQSDRGEIPPTPLIGMLGVIEDVDQALRLAPPVGQGALALLSVPEVEVRQGGLGASAFAALVCGQEDGLPVPPFLEGEVRLHRFLEALATRGLVASAHDVSEGGAAFAAAEIAMAGHYVEANLEGPAFAYAESATEAFFGEIPGRALVALDPARLKEVEELCAGHGLSMQLLGTYAPGDGLALAARGQSIAIDGVRMRAAYQGAIPSLMASGPVVESGGYVK
ncbi:MAG: phosphoribosylformylglycinamidine synthase subunit PurL [Fimbriimonadaceae bacterium]|nr:phosphoribosylformylglycinamidine synthase subunit PurL [Fimbriimonadaceae bacterium]